MCACGGNKQKDVITSAQLQAEADRRLADRKAEADAMIAAATAAQQNGNSR